ncbi:hypothetical protein GKQ38_04535 [Candidatus Nanohaloarchaea archaeon]|nr:hypothetical protein GKQ38_04535 [Candidatus Nanohaloarchaea archaeon]
MSEHGSSSNHHGPGNLEKTLANIFAATIISVARLAKSFMMSVFNFLLRFLHWL